MDDQPGKQNNPSEFFNSNPVINSFKKWICNNPFWALIYTIVLLYFVVRIIWWHGDDGNQDIIFNWKHFRGAIILPLLLLCGAIFVNLFTNRIELKPEDDPKEDPKSKSLSIQRRNWMIFAYSFMLLSLLLPIYLFSAGWENYGFLKSKDNPIAVFIGCSEDDGSTNLSCNPSGNARSTLSESTNNNSSAARISSQNEANSLRDNKSVHSAWVVNLGGHITNAVTKGSDLICGKNNSEPVCRVQGGIVVPLYVIILALIGGSISLTRQLPEYQKRANPLYKSTEKEPYLSQHLFREYLIFQMVQFLSAPFIAILAYYLIKPSDITNTVVVAFSAGFASQSVLVMIRAITEKITPNVESIKKYGTITGIVKMASNERNVPDSPLKDAIVSIAGSTQYKSITDDSGFYMLNNVPIGEHAVNVTASVATGDLEQSDSIKIDKSQDIITKHWLLGKQSKKA